MKWKAAEKENGIKAEFDWIPKHTQSCRFRMSVLGVFVLYRTKRKYLFAFSVIAIAKLCFKPAVYCLFYSQKRIARYFFSYALDTAFQLVGK